MIIAATCYDSVTCALQRYAAAIAGTDVVWIPEATAELVEAELERHKGSRTLCFFGIGYEEPPYFRGQDQQEILTATCIDFLRGYTIYGACCYSLCDAADILTAAGVDVVGFSDRLMLPAEERPSAPILDRYLQQSLLYFPKELLAGASVSRGLERARDAQQKNTRAAYAKLKSFEGQLLVARTLQANERAFGIRLAWS